MNRIVHIEITELIKIWKKHKHNVWMDKLINVDWNIKNEDILKSLILEFQDIFKDKNVSIEIYNSDNFWIIKENSQVIYYKFESK